MAEACAILGFNFKQHTAIKANAFMAVHGTDSANTINTFGSHSESSEWRLLLKLHNNTHVSSSDCPLDWSDNRGLVGVT